MGLFRRKDVTPSLDSVQFDDAGYRAREDSEPGERLWFSPEGDGVGLFLFTIPPDLPGAASMDELRAFYENGLKSSGGLLVETAVVMAGALPVVQLIAKVPQHPSGLTYMGSITIPFRDFSFVLKVQCEERGMTGMREAVLLDRRLAAGERPTFRDGRMQLSSWNPDAAEFDAEFPDHPVSRARRFLDGVRVSLFIDPLLGGCRRFPLPPVSS